VLPPNQREGQTGSTDAVKPFDYIEVTRGIALANSGDVSDQVLGKVTRRTTAAYPAACLMNS